ncbi:hypothetical protein VTL71DRAFT_658 [Oculimacula yallundae]|uniref:Uncharacterized protein n=1 Tax=Oculimacula yallundae TaxID=86028 RepID=A0ABR4D0P1_9HELO
MLQQRHSLNQASQQPRDALVATEHPLASNVRMAATAKISQDLTLAPNGNQLAEDAEGYVGSHPMVRENQAAAEENVQQHDGYQIVTILPTPYDRRRVYSVQLIHIDPSLPTTLCRVYGQLRQRVPNDDFVDKEDQDDKIRWDTWREKPAAQRANIVAYFEPGDELLDWKKFQEERAQRIKSLCKLVFLK